MSMISFVFFGFVAAVFILLLFADRIIKDEQTSVKASNLILLISSYLFMFYANWRFAIVLAVLSLSTWYFPQKKSTYKIGIIAAVSALVFFHNLVPALLHQPLGRGCGTAYPHRPGTVKQAEIYVLLTFYHI